MNQCVILFRIEKLQPSCFEWIFSFRITFTMFTPMSAVKFYRSGNIFAVRRLDSFRIHDFINRNTVVSRAQNRWLRLTVKVLIHFLLFGFANDVIIKVNKVSSLNIRSSSVGDSIHTIKTGANIVFLDDLFTDFETFVIFTLTYFTSIFRQFLSEDSNMFLA